jgi:hypothetical protein
MDSCRAVASLKTRSWCVAAGRAKSFSPLLCLYCHTQPSGRACQQQGAPVFRVSANWQQLECENSGRSANQLYRCPALFGETPTSAISLR